MKTKRKLKSASKKRNNQKKPAPWQGHRNRLIAVFVVFASGFLVLMIKLVLFQVWEDEKVDRQTQLQALKQITLTSPRGTIYDSNMQPMAMSVRVPSIYVDPKILRSSKEKTKRILKALDISQKTWKQKTKNKKKRFVWLKRKINPDIEETIRDIGLYGIGILHEWDRLYPFREQASQVLGFVNVDGKGMEGLERSFDQVLSSKNIVLKTKKDAKGRPILMKSGYGNQVEQASDIVLTLDQSLQYFLEDALKSASKKYEVASAFGILMDPLNGEVKAMASYPEMNPNRLELSKPSSWNNRNVLDVFEPGSTFKVFVMTQALEDQLIKPSDVMSCKDGSLTIGIKSIANPVEKSVLTPEGIIKYSNNVCMAKIGLKGGEKMMTRMIRNFGFGKKTGIEFPVEAKGLFDPSKEWGDMRLANIAFGQGLAVTGIQMASAMSLIANGGHRIKPHIVKWKQDPSGQKHSVYPDLKRKKILKSQTIAEIKSYLQAAIETDGTGRNASVPGYHVAGKTGTAQIFDLKEKHYSHEKVVSSFIGFAPVETPKLVMYVVFNSPKEPQYGGALAAPVFKETMSRALPYLHVPRDRKAPNQKGNK